jgi:hypothetical protein
LLTKIDHLCVTLELEIMEQENTVTLWRVTNTILLLLGWAKGSRISDSVFLLSSPSTSAISM